MTTFPLSHPTALACVPLLAPRHILGNGVEIGETDPLRPAYEVVYARRSALSRELGVIILGALDPPSDPDALAAIPPLVLHLLVQYRPQFAELFHEEISETVALLVDRGLISPFGEGIRESLAHGHKKTHPLFTMHVASATTQWISGTKILRTPLSQAYRKYALRCHLAFRNVESYYLPRATKFPPEVIKNHLYQCALSLRYLMQCLPIIDQSTDSATEDYEIGLALVQLAGNWKAGKAPLPVVVRRLRLHARHLSQALNALWSRRRGVSTGGRRRGIGASRELNDDAIELPTRLWPEDGDRSRGKGGWLYVTRCVSLYPRVSQEVFEVGECDDDYATDVIEARGAVAHNPRAARMAAIRAAQRLHRDAIWFPFCAEYVQLHEYARLYRYLFDRAFESLPLAEQTIVSAFLLLVHTGLDPDLLSLIRLHNGRRDGPTEQLAGSSLSLYRDSLALRRASPLADMGYRAAPFLCRNAFSRKAQDTVVVPLPEFLSRVVECYLHNRDNALGGKAIEEDDCLFLKGASPLTVDDLADYLRARGEPNPRRLVYRLARSFFPLYVSRLGFDPILASYISGRVPRVFATQVFYSHVDGDRLARAYRVKARHAHRLICTAAGLARSERRWSVKSMQRARPPLIPVGYGSRIVPRREALASFVASVRRALSRLEPLREESHRILHHNLYEAWGYVMFLLLSGARPMRDERLSAALEPLHPYRARILDKQSPAYVEMRTIRRHPFLLALYHELEKARCAAMALPSFDHAVYEELGSPLLFLLTFNGRPVAVTPAEVKRTLASVPEVSETFPFPLNTGRHLLETALAEARADRPSQDYSLGHQRRWREALNRFSAADLVFVESHFAEHVQRVVKEYGLEVLPYRPGDRS